MSSSTILSDLDHKLNLLRAFASGKKFDFASWEDKYGPKNCTNVMAEDRYRKPGEEYYETNCANVMAEAVAAFKSPPRSDLPYRLKLRQLEDDWIEVQPVKDWDADLNAQDIVLEHEGRLFWVIEAKTVWEAKTNQETKTKITKIQCFGTDSLILRLDGPGWHEVRNRLYGGDYMSRFRAAYKLQTSDAPVPALEAAVLNPGRQARGQYRPCREILRRVLKTNKEQEDAVRNVANYVEAVHGPPGTGKTSTAVNMVANRLPENQMCLITTVTNQAIDVMAQAFEVLHNLPDGEAFPMLVLGNAKRVGETAGKYTLPELVKQDPLFQAMKSTCDLLEKIWMAVGEEDLFMLPRALVDEQLTDLADRAEMMEDVVEASKRQTQHKHPIEVVNFVNLVIERVKKLLHKYYQWEHDDEWDLFAFQELLTSTMELASEGLFKVQRSAEERIVGRTRVILSTISSVYKVDRLRSLYPVFPEKMFLGILDEAAATSETYIPMLIDMGIQHLVMMGDHKQLRPMVVGNPAVLSGKNVGRSFMERCIAAGVKQHRLREQYRMPLILCKLVSMLFYREHPLSTGSNKPQHCPRSILRWIKVEHPQGHHGTSFFNVGEVIEIYHLLSNDGVLSRQTLKITIITFLKPQERLIANMVKRFFPNRPVRVITVDAAQGSQDDHIILSTVRCNRGGYIGFAKEANRINVALSRTKETLTIVGSVDTFLKYGSFWKEIHSHFEKFGTITRAKGSSSGELRDFVRGAVKSIKGQDSDEEVSDEQDPDEQDSNEADKPRAADEWTVLSSLPTSHNGSKLSKVEEPALHSLPTSRKGSQLSEVEEWPALSSVPTSHKGSKWSKVVKWRAFHSRPTYHKGSKLSEVEAFFAPPGLPHPIADNVSERQGRRVHAGADVQQSSAAASSSGQQSSAAVSSSAHNKINLTRPQSRVEAWMSQ
mmetsp:Transcript_47960/g.102688  ORF Transcript_47960/g.102688 Transcript_47960/m.102688 type:complete len:938 (+) Transcript_47960:127-2940(+)